MLKLLVIFVIITSTACYAEIMEPRQKQLDSFVTNLPRDYVRDLDSAHYYMNREGRNNEERVFMFYGFFGIHFKYDHNRAVQKQDVKEYSPYYTCRKRSGVCRDFSVLFKELCDRSGIPCFIALGRAKPGMKRALKDIVFMRMRAPSHAWNVVTSRVELTNDLITSNFNLDISGASSFQGGITASESDLRISGASRVEVWGATTNAEVNISGASNLADFAFTITDFLEIDLSGASKAELTVDGTMNIKASGASTFNYKGKGGD